MTDAMYRESLDRLHAWIEGHGWSSYDHYDIEDRLARLRCRCGPRVAAGLRVLTRRMERLYPRLLRIALGVKRKIWPEAIGILGAAYAMLGQCSGNEHYLSVARNCADWLLDNTSENYSGLGWGIPIVWQSRVIIPPNTVCCTTTAQCGELFLLLYQHSGESRLLESCRRICYGFLSGLNIDRIDESTICFSYTPVDHFHVHNANLLVASFLARVSVVTGDLTLRQAGIEAGNFALREQRSDGSLNYWADDQAGGHFRSDLYHACFDLRSYYELWAATGQTKFLDALRAYFDYCICTYIRSDGAPKLEPKRDKVVEIRGCAEWISCLCRLATIFPQAQGLLRSATTWTIQNMQTRDGHFIYRLWGDSRIDMPYMRWGQAPMLYALASQAVQAGHSKTETRVVLPPKETDSIFP